MREKKCLDWHDVGTGYPVLREIWTIVCNQCLDTMGRKQNDNVEIYTGHEQGGNKKNFISLVTLTVYLFRFSLIQKRYKKLCLKYPGNYLNYFVS